MTTRQYGTPYKRLKLGAPGRVLVDRRRHGQRRLDRTDRGRRHVDAVEIDPQILASAGACTPTGRTTIRESPRTSTDGRAFLERTNERYDLILFALPDSLTLVTGASAIRLESYLFTREAMEAVREAPQPTDGGFAMYNLLQADLAGGPVRRTGRGRVRARAVHRHVQRGRQQAVISVGGRRARPAVRARPWARRRRPARRAGDRRPSVPRTFRGGRLPSLYLFALGAILLVSLIAVRVLAGPFRPMRQYADLFFMGAAFLLLETKSVDDLRASLRYDVGRERDRVRGRAPGGAARRRDDPPFPDAGAACALSRASRSPSPLPTSCRTHLCSHCRSRCASSRRSSLAFAPIFLANLAFAKRFAGTDDAPSAFGVNILGAMVGGCIEYLALIVGFRNLLLVAGLLYLCAFALLPLGGGCGRRLAEGLRITRARAAPRAAHAT